MYFIIFFQMVLLRGATSINIYIYIFKKKKERKKEGTGG